MTDRQIVLRIIPTTAFENVADDALVDLIRALPIYDIAYRVTDVSTDPGIIVTLEIVKGFRMTPLTWFLTSIGRIGAFSVEVVSDTLKPFKS